MPLSSCTEHSALTRECSRLRRKVKRSHTGCMVRRIPYRPAESRPMPSSLLRPCSCHRAHAMLAHWAHSPPPTRDHRQSRGPPAVDNASGQGRGRVGTPKGGLRAQCQGAEKSPVLGSVVGWLQRGGNGAQQVLAQTGASWSCAASAGMARRDARRDGGLIGEALQGTACSAPRPACPSGPWPPAGWCLQTARRAVRLLSRADSVAAEWDRHCSPPTSWPAKGS